MRERTAISMAILAAASTASPNCYGAKLRMNELYANAVRDTFYTTRPGDIRAAQGIGAIHRGTAFEVEDAKVAGSKAWRRFYCAQTTDHFYTHDDADASIATGAGCVDEGIEGYVFPTQRTGTVALTRLHWNNFAGNVEHYYTTEPETVTRLVAEGWNKDGVVAYVYGTSYCSAFVDLSAPPAVLFDTYYPVSVAMKNSCPATWKTGEVVLRVSGDWNWTPNAVPAPRNIGFGQSIKFEFNAKTPPCFSIGGFGYCGDERFVWRMKKGNMDFGESTPLLKVLVGWEKGPTGPLNIPSDPIVPSPLPYGQPVPANAPPPPMPPGW